MIWGNQLRSQVVHEWKYRHRTRCVAYSRTGRDDAYWSWSGRSDSTGLLTIAGEIWWHKSVDCGISVQQVDDAMEVWRNT